MPRSRGNRSNFSELRRRHFDIVFAIQRLKCGSKFLNHRNIVRLNHHGFTV